MTDETKRTLLEYMSGKLENNCGDNIPQFTNLNNKTNNLEDMFKERNINFSILGFAESPKTSNILLYGNNSIGKLDYGVIVVLDSEFNVLEIIEGFNSGTRFRQFICLDFDSEGNCYGIDNVENIDEPNKFRFILLNNFLIKLGNKYQVVLRNSYYFPDEYNSMYFEDPRNTNKIMKKDFANAYYSFFEGDSNTLKGRLITLKINVGAENEWKHYDFNENLQPQLFDYSISFLEDGIDFDVCVINETNFYRLKNVGDTINKYFQLSLGDISFGQSLIKINDNKIYLTTSKKLIDSNSYETKIMMISNNKLYEIFSETKESSYLSNICRLVTKNNDCFVVRYNFRNDPDIYYNVDFYTGILLENKYYEKYLGYFELNSYSAGNMFVKNEFNLFKICVLDVNNIKYSSLVYNNLNYNGTPCIQPNSLVPNSGILYQNNMPVFARNLYNKSLNDNLTVSTIEVPNNYLNNILVNREVLKSKTNLSLVDKSEQIIKNEYENVYINFLNSINMRNENDPQRPVSNLTGAIRVINSINLENDVDNTKVTKCKIVYDSGKEVVKNIQVDLANNTVTGSNPTLTNSLNKKINYLKVEGKTVQKTTIGKQLYNFQDTTNVTSGITVDKEGWITVTGDNTGGSSNKYYNYYTKNLNLKTNTNYRIVTEIKKVNGTGKVVSVSQYNNTGQFANVVSYDFQNIVNNSILCATSTTINDFSSSSQGLRSAITFPPGTSGSITFRLSVLEDTMITPENFVYEPYTGEKPSPRPDYPQEINNVKGYRNLFDIGTSLDDYFATGNNGLTISASNIKDYVTANFTEKKVVIDSYDNTNYRWMSKEIVLKKNADYLISGLLNKSLIVKVVGIDNLNVSTVGKQVGYMDNVNSKSPQKFNSGNYNKYIISIYPNQAGASFEDLQIIEGKTPRPYVPYGSNYLELKSNSKNPFDIDTLLENQIDVLRGTLEKDLDNKSITIKSTGEDCYISNTYHMSKEPSQNQINGINKYGIQILSNTKYTWSFDVSNLTGTGSQYMFFYDENYIFLYLKSINVNKNGIASITIETEANVKYVCFRFGLSKTGYAITIKNVQFEKGDKVTKYEQYQANSILLNLQNNEICEGDTLIVQNGYASIDKNKKILELTGEENWGFNNDIGGYFQYYIKIQNSKPNGLSNYFKYSKTGYTEGNKFYISVIGNFVFMHPMYQGKDIEGLDNWKQFLRDMKSKGTPVIVQYELANNENIGLGLQEQLTAYDNVTYISCDDDLQPNLEVNYLINENYSTLSTTIYVDELLKELQFISNDEKTVYQTIDISNLQVGNYYTINQRMEVK